MGAPLLAFLPMPVRSTYSSLEEKVRHALAKKEWTGCKTPVMVRVRLGSLPPHLRPRYVLYGPILTLAFVVYGRRLGVDPVPGLPALTVVCVWLQLFRIPRDAYLLPLLIIRVV